MFTRFIALAALLVVTAAAGAPAVIASTSVPSDAAAIVHALNRLTYGPRPGDVERVKAIGLQRWIDLQLNAGRIDNSGLDARLQRLDTLMLDPATIQREYSGPAMQERRRRQAAEGADQPRATEGTESSDQKARATEGTESSDRMV